MAKSKDLFDDTTMTFGEHLEVLRMHLWKAIIGLVLCVTLALFFGNHVITIIQKPINDALQTHGLVAQDDVSGFDLLKWIRSGFSGDAGNAPAGISGAGLRPLAELPELRRIDLRGTEISGEALRALKVARPAAELLLDPLAVAGLADWKPLGAQARLNDEFQLVALIVRHPQFADAQLPRLADHPQLEHLDLAGTGISHRGLAVLQELPALKSLSLRSTAVSDAALESVQAVAGLEELDISRTAVSDRGLERLGSLSRLRRLAIGGPQITDAGMPALARLRGLRELDLRGARLSDAGVAHLSQLRELTALHLAGNSITDAGVESLTVLGGIERLTLAGTSLTDRGAALLAGFPRLRELSFFDEQRSAQEAAAGERVDAADERTITVSVQPSQLAAVLNRADPQAYPAPQPEAGERPVRLSIAAPEFKEFRETAVNVKKPVTLNVQEAFLMYLKVAFISGLVLASPWVFYQLWLFVAAGLYPHERRYVHVYLPVSVVLFAGGALFCFFLVFPFVLRFLLGFNAWLGVYPQIRMSEWVSFAIMMPVMFGLSFQLPLVMLFLERISIFEAKDYREKRRMAILVISIVSMLMTPADPMSMLLMMFPLLALYELGIFMCSVSPAQPNPFAGEAA